MRERLVALCAGILDKLCTEFAAVELDLLTIVAAAFPVCASPIFAQHEELVAVGA